MSARERVASPRERLAWLTRNATTWVLALVLLVIAGAVGASVTLGLFGSSSANPRNVVSAGSMSQVNSAGNAAIMSAQGLVPGERVEGEATIQNAGDARGDFRLLATDVEDDPGSGGGLLSERLVLRVEDADVGEQVYEGPLGELDADLGTWAPEETHRYVFVVTFPAHADDDAFQRSTLTATFVWDAVQAP